MEFINDHQKQLTQRLSREKKSMYITGDWNFNLLEFSKYDKTLTFYETMMANLLAPTITIPTRININTGTLNDDIFSNYILPDNKFGNLMVSISNHLPSFLIVPNENKQRKLQKIIQYKRDTRNFNSRSQTETE